MIHHVRPPLSNLTHREASLSKPVELERIEKLLAADGGEMQTWPGHEHEIFLQVCARSLLVGRCFFLWFFGAKLT